jgi:hypothetical protein
LIGPSFKHGLMVILVFAVVMSVIAAIASALRGEKFVHVDEESRAQKARHTVHSRHLDDEAAGAQIVGDGTVEPVGSGPLPGELVRSAVQDDGAVYGEEVGDGGRCE